jgi:hypothetical protein
MSNITELFHDFNATRFSLPLHARPLPRRLVAYGVDRRGIVVAMWWGPAR